jgi:hypothetical protein
MTRRNQHYPPELRERAVRMVAEMTPDQDHDLSQVRWEDPLGLPPARHRDSSLGCGTPPGVQVERVTPQPVVARRVASITTTAKRALPGQPERGVHVGLLPAEQHAGRG